MQRVKLTPCYFGLVIYLAGGLEGTTPNRGGAPIVGQLLRSQGITFQSMFHTALASILI